MTGTDDARLLRTLVERDQWHRAVLEAAQEGVWVTDATDRTVYANQMMAELLAVPLDTLRSSSVTDVLDRLDAEAAATVRRHLARRVAGVREQYELAVRGGDAERRWLLVVGAPMHDQYGTYVGSVGMCADITERKQAEEELRRLALYDSLTGLPNRALLLDRLQLLSEQHGDGGAGFGLCLGDMDSFKAVNTAHGHAGGDAVLASAAARMRQATRAGDTVARMAGDEFVVLCPGADTRTTERVAKEVSAALTAPVPVDDGGAQVSISLGVAATDEVPPAQLLQAADTALYEAKARGGDRIVVHDPAVAAMAVDRRRMVAGLRQALDTDQLEVWYQPIVELATGRPVGFEALTRWPHPELGSVPPASFIPLAEDHQLMGRLGGWALERACSDMTRTRFLDGVDWHVAVNLSPTQLADPAVVEVVRAALERSALPPGQLLLEVTETALLSRAGPAVATLHSLTDLGVRVALDDFGTGYSSLSHLRELPVHAIKIDRSFVTGLDPVDRRAAADDSAIVASLIGLASAVGVDVIAEGVETAVQADALRRLGCPLSQGYLWSAATPLAQVPQVLQRLSGG